MGLMGSGKGWGLELDVKDVLTVAGGADAVVGLEAQLADLRVGEVVEVEGCEEQEGEDQGAEAEGRE